MFDSWVGKIPWRRAFATHVSILVWRIPWTEEPGGLQSMGVTKSQTQLKKLSTHTHTHRILLSHKKEIMLFRATWTDLEIIILSEVSQTRKISILGYNLCVESKN